MENPNRPMALFVCGLLALTIIVVLSGCGSGAAEINARAELVRTEAGFAKAELDEAIATGEVGPKALPLVESASARQDAIVEQAAGVQAAVSRVEDRDGPILRILRYIVVIVAVLGVLFVLIRFGPIVGLVVSWIVAIVPKARAVIPTKVRDQVKLDAEAMEADPANGRLREAVAVARAQDRLYDAAWRTMP